MQPQDNINYEELVNEQLKEIINLINEINNKLKG